jgi:hypothetical protein
MQLSTFQVKLLTREYLNENPYSVIAYGLPNDGLVTNNFLKHSKSIGHST